MKIGEAKLFNNTYKFCNTISVILHITLIIVLLRLCAINVITPSRSNGVTVNILNSSPTVDNIKNDLTNSHNDTKTVKQPQVNKLLIKPVSNIPILNNTNADINIKANNKTSTKILKHESQILSQPIDQKNKLLVLKKNKQDNSKFTNKLLDNLLDNTNHKEYDPHKNNKTIVKEQIQKQQLKQLMDTLNAHDDVLKNGDSNAKFVGGNKLGSSNSKELLNNYADLVINKILPYVKIPNEVINNHHIATIVKVSLSIDMHVKNATLISSSGNNEYDNSVVSAIYKVAIFPPLPSGAKFSDYQILFLKFRPT